MARMMYALIPILALVTMAASTAPTGSNKFAYDLYTNCVAEKGGNVIISPLSVETALSMVYTGARGDTAAEMALGLKYENSEPNAVASKVGGVAKSYNVEGSPVSIANNVYLMTGYEVKPQFRETATKSFDSDIEAVDFSQSSEAAKKINDWVEQKTHNKIKDLIDPSLLDSLTRMVLVNAIYFKGKWAHEFDKQHTSKADFWTSETEKSQVDMMFIKEKFRYADLPELQASAIEVPYANSSLVMLIVLPNEKTGLAKLEADLANVDLAEISKKMHKVEVNLYMPRFKVEYDLSLKKPLQKMGMNKMFNDDADFGNLLNSPEQLKVSEVVHKAFIEVNEEGTEAAAATGLMIVPLSYRPTKYFKVNRPFTFAIRDNASSRTPLFMGSLEQI